MAELDEWCLYEVYLIIYFIMKFVFTALSMSCLVPGVIFTPTFTMGAVFG